MYITTPAPKNDTYTSWVQYLGELSESRENSSRKADSFRLHKLFKGKQRDETKATLIDRIGNQVTRNKHPIWTQNVLKLGVKMLASTYDGVIERTIGDVDEEVLSDIQEKMWANLNKTMSTASDLLVYDRMALIQVIERPDELAYMTYNQYQYDLVYQGRDLVAVILSDYGIESEKTNYRIYTSENTWHLHGKELVSQEDNQLNVLPFVVVYAEERGFYDYLMPMAEYADAQIELNCVLSGNLYTHQLQSHAVLWTRLTPDSALGETIEEPGGSSFDSDQAGPTIPIPSAAQTVTLYEDEQGRKEEIGYLTPGINFQDILGVGKEYILNFFEDMGIPRDAITIDGSGATIKPATAGYLAERKLQDLNIPYKSVFASAEKELFGVALDVAEASNIINIQGIDHGSFSVSFRSQARRLDSLEYSELIDLYKNKIIDKAEALRMINGSTRSEAIEALEMMGLDEQPKETSDENQKIDEDVDDDVRKTQ